MKVTNKSVGTLLSVLGGVFFLSGILILLIPAFHTYINYPYGIGVAMSSFLSREGFAGIVLIIIGGRILYLGVKRLRM